MNIKNKKRLLSLPRNQSLFLFGARNTGKTTLLKENFSAKNSLWLDLLDPELEEQLAQKPMDLQAMVQAMPSKQKYVVIDEIQKVPKLLSVVHKLIESTDKLFIMSGSSARKLKRGAANLLAGRAFVYHLYPFSSLELKEQFKLQHALEWGLLPKISSLNSNNLKTKFLQSYAHTYLKEEIWAEQIVRKLNPFRKFLEVAAQANGKIINYSNIARDVGADAKTIKEYFIILEDTLIGHYLEPFTHSFRKRLGQKPKFYFFDTGVTRALSRTLSIPLKSSTSAYGEAFEHFIITECMKLASYYKPEYRFSFLNTKDGAEIDLIVDRPGKPHLFIEIKSSTNVNPEKLSTFSKLTKDFKKCEAICFSQDKITKRYDNVTVIPWQEGVKIYFAD